MRKYLLWTILLPLCGAIAAPVRVVSLAPAVTDIIIAIGGAADLAGKSSSCDAPQVKNIPVAGDLGIPFTEPVLKSGANLVLSDTRAPGPQWELLQKCGIHTEVLPGKTLSDLPRNIRRIGFLLRRQSAAEKLASDIEKQIASLQQNPPRAKYRTLIVLGLPPVVSCGKTSFITGAMQLAGVENISAGIPKSYFVLNPETISAAMPELIISFFSPDATAKYFSRAEFRHIPAVKNRKFLYPPIQKLCRLTPELPQALLDLKSAVERNFLQKQP